MLMTAEPTPPPGGDFRTTRWTQINRAKAGSSGGRQALAELCGAYYEPVAAFLRHELRDAEAARDLAHDFFAHLLAGGGIARAGPEHGRFRSYLLGAVKHFLSHQRQAARRLKRGGGAATLSLNDPEAQVVPDAGGLSPDAAFDRQWALTVVARALAALREECAVAGRAEFFERVKPWLTGEAAHGDQSALAAASGLNANALKVAIHRLKRRFRQLVQAEVAGTLADPGQVEAEMRALFAALGS
jgi:RNA polymerase sigma-70 factor (ECF subfamily)